MRAVYFVIFLLFAGVGFCAEISIYSVSRSDMNRIVCPDAVERVIVSEEKEITSEIVGKEAFIKFPVAITIDQETGTRTTSYSSSDAELFLICGGATYNMILQPKAIPSQTIEIKAKEEKEAVAPELKGKDAEAILGTLTKFAIEGSFPGSFVEKKLNYGFDINRGSGKLSVIYRRLWSGSGYLVKEFHIYSKGEVTLLPVEMVSFPVVEEPLALSITSETFKGWTRGFVIERSK